MPSIIELSSITIVLWLTVSILAAEQDQLAPIADPRIPNVNQVFERLRAHDYQPLDNRAFTTDRHLRKHGIADMNDTDWQLRLLAVRDLVRGGKEAIPSIIKGLDDTNVQVRYVSVTALGVQRARNAVSSLSRVLEKDAQAVVRSQAAVALGQIGDKASLATLYSLVTSAKRAGLDTWLYLRDLLTRMPSAPMSQLPDFLPDRWCHPAIEKLPNEQRGEG